MAVDLLIMSQGIIGNKMKEFFFNFQGVTEPLMRRNKIPINGPILIEKTKEFATELDCENFHASNGWLRGSRK